MWDFFCPDSWGLGMQCDVDQVTFNFGHECVVGLLSGTRAFPPPFPVPARFSPIYGRDLGDFGSRILYLVGTT